MQIKPCHLPASPLLLALISLYVKITLLSRAHLPLIPTHCLISLNTLSYFQYLSVPRSLSSPALSPDLSSHHFLGFLAGRGLTILSTWVSPNPSLSCCHHSSLSSAHAYKQTLLKLFIFVNGLSKTNVWLHLIFRGLVAKCCLHVY